MNDTRGNAAEARLNPASLTPADAARLLKVEPEWIETDIEAGAPTNVDGTINLVCYAAWLNLQMGEGDDADS